MELALIFSTLKSKVGPYDINKPVEHLPENGLGLYLINTLMDDIQIMHDEGHEQFTNDKIYTKRAGGE